MASFRTQAIVALVGIALIIAVLLGGAGNSVVGLPQTGNTYVEAAVGAPRYINPLLAQSDSDLDLAHLVFSGLTRVDAQGNLAPDLASEWHVSPDSTVYTFTLKPDLLWHDGKPLTSDDVYFTLSLMRDPEFPGGPMLAARWKDVRVDAPTLRTIILTLPAPNASFLQYTTLGILPRHLWSDVPVPALDVSDLNMQPVGSGAWRVVRATGSLVKGVGGEAVSRSAGNSAESPGVTLEPNMNGRARPTGISRLWFRVYPTFDAALSALKTGEAHGIGHIPQGRVTEVASIPGVELHRQPLARLAMLLFNTRSPLLEDKRVRLGIEFAINNQQIVEQLPSYMGLVANSPILAGSWAYSSSDRNDAHPPRGDYAPGAAKIFLDEAGWAVGPDGKRQRNGATLSLVLAVNQESPSNVAVAEAIQAQLQAVGVDVSVATVGRDRLLNDYLRPGAFHLALITWEAQGADPDVYSYWHSVEPGASTLNFSGWSNPIADAALEAAHVSPERSVRVKHYADFQAAFREDAPAVVLYNPLYAYATRSEVRGVALPSMNMLNAACRFETIDQWHFQIENEQ